MWKFKKNLVDQKMDIDQSPIFQLISQKGNDQLSHMSGKDLQYLLILMDPYYIQLRKQLNLNSNVTFGLELEFENAMKEKISKDLKETFPEREWFIKEDCTLDDGAEINSPILKDDISTWKNLETVCSIIKPVASIGGNSGGHIHIGTQALGDKKDSWLNFFKLWAVYENIIFRFSYGDFLTARPNIVVYARPLAVTFWDHYCTFQDKNIHLEDIILEISRRKFQAVNLKNVCKNNLDALKLGNTIEFRCPNGSLEAAIWQNNVLFFVSLLTYAKNPSFDDDLISKRCQAYFDKFSDLKWYDEIYLEQALELCDMIFSNNLDKIYFLKQYLKSFQICKKRSKFPAPCTKTKTLVKKKI